jgi:hypothetical protein
MVETKNHRVWGQLSLQKSKWQKWWQQHRPSYHTSLHSAAACWCCSHRQHHPTHRRPPSVPACSCVLDAERPKQPILALIHGATSVGLGLLVSGTANEEIAAAPDPTTLPLLGSGHCCIVLASLHLASPCLTPREGTQVIRWEAVHLQLLRLHRHITIKWRGIWITNNQLSSNSGTWANSPQQPATLETWVHRSTKTQ